MNKETSAPISCDQKVGQQENSVIYNIFENYRKCQKELEFLNSHIKKVLKKKFKMNNTLLHLAVKDKKMDIVLELLMRNVDINLQNDLGDTPLHIAAANNDEEMINLLLDNCAKTGIRNCENQTYLDVIKMQNSNAGVKNLISIFEKKTSV